MKKKLLLIFILLLGVSFVTGCKKDTKEPEQEVDPYEKEIREQQAKDFESNYDNYKDVDATYDDTKIVIASGNSKQIYYHDGTNITGYESQITFASNEVANTAKESFSTMPNVENANVVGNTLYVKYDKNAYKDKTYSEIKLAYDNIIEIQKGNE